MPYEWVKQIDTASENPGAVSASDDGVIAELHLWPYRSLPKRGFATFIAITCAMIALPLIAMLGSPILWGLLPFIVLTVAGVWWAIQRSYNDGSILEQLVLRRELVQLTRQNPRGSDQNWDANPYWVDLQLHPADGPVENYITLRGNDREVELGAFLTVEERETLFEELQQALVAVRSYAPRNP